MPTIHAHGNMYVSKIWFVVLAALVSMVLIVWDASRSIREIELSILETRSQMEKLLEE